MSFDTIKIQGTATAFKIYINDSITKSQLKPKFLELIQNFEYIFSCLIITTVSNIALQVHNMKIHFGRRLLLVTRRTCITFNKQSIAISWTYKSYCTTLQSVETFGHCHIFHNNNNTLVCFSIKYFCMCNILINSELDTVSTSKFVIDDYNQQNTMYSNRSNNKWWWSIVIKI